MGEAAALWVGKDEHNGVPSQPRVDLPPPPHWRLEVVAAVERPHHLEVSPDGNELVFVLDRDGSDLWTIGAAGGPPDRITVGRDPAPYWEDTQPVWSPDGESVAYGQAGEVLVVPARGGPTRRLVEGGEPTWIDRQRLLITVDRHRVGRLAVVDVDDPWPQAVGVDGGDSSSAVVAPDGKQAVFVWFPPDDRQRSDLMALDLGSGTVRSLSGTPGYRLHSPAIDPDGGVVAFVSERSGRHELHLVGLDGSGERRLTAAGADFSAPRWHPSGDRLVTIMTDAGRSHLVEVDAGDGQVRIVAEGGTWSNPNWVGEGAVSALYEDHRTPPQIRRVDPDGTITVLFAPAPAPVRTAPHVTPTEVRFPSFDGLEIPALLFRPRPNGGRPAPAVVYPHGGPTSHYGDEWDGHAQYFLDKGYAWLAINFRGSTSYGLEFERANHGVWGVADTEDCLAAYDYLAGLEWIDPRRIAIFGASYGSYLALSSLVLDPSHRFAAGVAKYGDCDILTSWAQGDRPGSDDLERMMGHPAHNPAGYREGSPYHRLSELERPILVAHGEQDERVHPRQSQQLVDRLRRLDKTYEYVTYPTEGHGLLRTGPQLHFYRRLERFLDWYLM